MFKWNEWNICEISIRKQKKKSFNLRYYNDNETEILTN